MNIDVVSIAAAEPPSAPQAAAAPSARGPAFGLFLDASNSSAAQPATAIAQPAAAIAQTAAAPARKSSPSSSPLPAKDSGHGDGAADSADHASTDAAVPCAGGLALPGPAAFVPVVVPTGTLAPPATSILANADKTQAGAGQSVTGDAAAPNLSSLAAVGPKSPSAWQAVVSAANLQTGTPTASAQTGGPQADITQTALQGAPNSTATALATPSNSTLLPTPPIPGTATPPATVAPATVAPATVAPAATPGAGAPNNRATGNVSAQAAALLGRVSVVSTAQIPEAPPTGAAGAALSGTTANSVIGATVPTESAAAPVSLPAPATPLPPVSGNIDLSAKFSATAIPARGDVASPATGKVKVDAHTTAGTADAIAGRPLATAASASLETTGAPGAAKPASDAPLAATATSGSGLPSEDDAAGARVADSTAGTLQPRADLVGVAAGPAAPSAPEKPVSPIAALHAVVDQVAIGVKRGVKAGNDQIQINIEPASLGKIAVRLDFAQDGRVSATFSADRADTLNLLNNDSRRLEQALRDAGLRTDSGSLTFNMSGGDTGASTRQFAQSAGYAASLAAMGDNEPAAPLAAARAAASGLSHDGSLDIHV